MICLLFVGTTSLAQSKTKFTLHVSEVNRTGVVLDVRAESKTVRYDLTCTETTQQNTCYMPQAGTDYQAQVAPDPQFLYVYGITKNTTIFWITSESEKTHRNTR